MAQFWNFEASPLRGVRRRVKAFRDCESGATAIEYGLIVALIFLGIVSALRAYSSSASGVYDDIGTAMDDAGS
ncbi:Flp family type IVb pilin [Marinicaulis aureus]|uniref:Flp family type IVb pilin n=1 Tax=Hyphococcus aureus TaxID=2666033 RepID=A0ABW1L3I3_9PROT